MIVTLSKNNYRAGSPYADVEESHIAAELNPPILIASGYVGNLEISDNGAGGDFSYVPGHTDRWIYIPANESKSIVLTVTDDVSIVEKNLTVTGTFPIQPMYGFEWGMPTNTKVLTAKDNSPKFRRPRFRQGQWTLSFLNRTILDLSVLKAFELFHDIDVEFYWQDIETENMLLVRFDSEVKAKTEGANKFELSCVLKAYKMPVDFTIPTAYTI